MSPEVDRNATGLPNLSPTRLETAESTPRNGRKAGAQRQSMLADFTSHNVELHTPQDNTASVPTLLERTEVHV